MVLRKNRISQDRKNKRKKQKIGFSDSAKIINLP